jgi:YbbR domain-containing protein
MGKASNFFRKILNNNKILAVICFITAVIIWLVVAVELSPETTVTLTDVPVTLDADSVNKSFGLSPFGETDFKVDVTVTGRRLIVESEDFRNGVSVVANTGPVTSAGNYSLRLDAQLSSNSENVVINSLSYSSISVYFDYAAQEEFTVEPVIANESGFVAEGYTAGEPYVSSKKITVNGPESEVNKITGLEAVVRVEENSTATQVIAADITAKSSSSVNFNYITMHKLSGTAETKTVDVTVPIYKIVTLTTGVGFTGKPSAYSDSSAFSYTVSPSFVKLGIPESREESMVNLVVKKRDFSELKPGENKFTAEASEVENSGCVILDGTKKFDIVINVNDVETAVIDAPETVECINVPDGIKVSGAVPGFDSVTIAGPSGAVGAVTLDGTNFGADLSALTGEEKGEISVPVVFADDNCWAIGDYTATVVVE